MDSRVLRLKTELTTLFMQTDSKLGALGALMDGKLRALSEEIKVILSGMDSLFTCITNSNKNTDKVYEVVQSVSEAVQKAHLKITANEIKLERISNRVTQNRVEITLVKKEVEETEETIGSANEKINKLEESIAALTQEKLQSSSYAVPNFLTSSSVAARMWRLKLLW